MAHQDATRMKAQRRDREIPDKLYFRIGEVARLCEVAPYVLRFWESEFPQLKPNKGGTGQRLYRKRDVEMALRIKRLLYDEGYTIPGARQVFKAETKHKEPLLPFRVEEPASVDSGKLRQLRKEMRELMTLLSRPSPGSGRSASARRGALQAVPAVGFDNGDGKKSTP
jgi:DNA-binding transcriptional MerR regulator